MVCERHDLVRRHPGAPARPSGSTSARYRGELAGHGEPIGQLRDRAEQGRVTIVYATRDEQHNNAAVLAELLRDG